jgi:glycosyltransferase involved in cell wall biosynthesis
VTVTSFVLPVYNAGGALGGTIDSILAQSDADFELIVVDDGSTDASHAIVVNYAARDSRIRLITQENRGITRALIAGCAAARGRYIARHDAGDLSDPRRLALQRAALDAHDDVVFVSCATQFAGPELEPLYVLRSSPAAWQPVNVAGADGNLSDGPTHHGSVVFRRDAYERVGGYRAEFYYGQDFDLWYRLADAGKFQSIDEVLYTARIAPGSITAAARARQKEIGRLSHAALLARRRGESDAAILARAAAIDRTPARESGRAEMLYFIGEALRRNGDRRARRYFRDAIAAAPLMPRAWVRYLHSLLVKLR